MKMTVLMIKPGLEPEVVDIDSGLESLQKAVEGDIAATYPYEDPVAIIYNDEGKNMHLPWNRALRDECGDIYDIIAGNFLIVGLTEENFGSLSHELIEKYRTLFEHPEQIYVSRKIIAAEPVKKKLILDEAPYERLVWPVNLS